MICKVRYLISHIFRARKGTGKIPKGTVQVYLSSVSLSPFLHQQQWLHYGHCQHYGHCLHYRQVAKMVKVFLLLQDMINCFFIKNDIKLSEQSIFLNTFLKIYLHFLYKFAYISETN